MDIVFFDASVLFKAAVCRFLLGAAEAGEIRAIWSERVVEEARRNLTESRRASALVAFEQNLQLVRDPIVSSDASVERSLKGTHVDDRHVLAAARAGGASVVVTDNPKDFDANEAAELGVTVTTSDELARRIAERNPAALVRNVQRTPPERLDRYVAILARELPRAMEILMPLLYE